MFSLDDESSKNLGEIISNETARKIINFLAEKEASPSEIAKELNLKLNTVGYNIEKLVKAGLIEEKKHWWSIKGKKIPVYTVSNKNIIISPGKNLSSKIKPILPIVTVAGIFTFLILFFNKGNVVQQTFEESGEKILASVPEATSAARDVVVNSGLGAGAWFLIVAWALVLIFIIYSLIKKD